MASKQRMIDPKLWSDQWVRKLNPLDRYLFIYLLTNERSSWCGVYELDIGVMAFESGIDERDLERSMLPRLSPKVLYVDGWVCFRNWSKYHDNGSQQTKKGIENAWEAVPEKIRLKIKRLCDLKIPPIDPLQGRSSLTSSLTSTLTLKEIHCDENIAEDDVQIIPEPVTRPRKKKLPVPDVPFSMQEQLDKLKTNTARRDLRIISFYMLKKKYQFENQKQFNTELKRCLRPAKLLEGYKTEQINASINYCKEKFELWTLESVGKRIADLVNTK